MSKCPETILVVAMIAAGLFAAPALAQEGDAAAGKKVFNRCRACHDVGEGARNKIGPHLNDLYGRSAGGLDDYNYSPVVKTAGAEGLVWNDETLAAYLADPRGMLPGNRMAFPGLKKDSEVTDLLAYLATFSAEQAAEAAPPAAAEDASSEPEAEAEPQPDAVAQGSPHGSAASASAPTQHSESSTGPRRLGRAATDAEVAAWDIDIRPDGKGLPIGSGTVADGEVIFTEQCASCHGDFGEGRGRWPVLAGGRDTLTRERPEKTVGSYWPHLSTAYDYIRRAMPFGNARSLSDDDVYALTAYVLYLNDVVTDEEFELSNENFTTIEMPNAGGFIPDDRASEAHYTADADPCMSDCKPGPVSITSRAQVLDVTPDSGGEGPAGGNFD
ncbi:diheme cytochrome c SoxD [Aurantimonas manganoxydans SI85-9A1]|uniref:Diheme cytochrome c SoxD n=1 Tax=Aurantimonas manganoxydans (strain ATCC BAA-1229 / DSM 21871 / SI85-9A1) TaxID=287752 RepID=Q1YN57_AURMS|nr:c-type cytochrome [Aurantimonas manganoxydans]EAS51174.1 diheme cytochrome c SoxD [Aurantimonas manganoxydans SI85-9A1]